MLLLIDEAHNCGEVLLEVQSVRLEEESLTQASHRAPQLKKTMKGVEAVRHLLPRITGFMEGLKGSLEAEDWFDPAIFGRIILKSSLYGSLSEIVEELMIISEKIRESNIRAGEFRETAIERLTAFMVRLEQSASDSSYLTIYRKDETSLVTRSAGISIPAPDSGTLPRRTIAVPLYQGLFLPLKAIKNIISGMQASLPARYPILSRGRTGG